MVNKISKIDKSTINFDKIYRTKNDAVNKIHAIKGNEQYWGDNDSTLTFDADNYAVYEQNGDKIYLMGFVNPEEFNVTESPINNNGINEQQIIESMQKAREEQSNNINTIDEQMDSTLSNNDNINIDDNNTIEQISNTAENNSNTTEQVSNTAENNSNTTEQVSNTENNDSNTIEQINSAVENDSNTIEQISNNAENDSNTNEQINNNENNVSETIEQINSLSEFNTSDKEINSESNLGENTQPESIQSIQEEPATLEVEEVNDENIVENESSEEIGDEISNISQDNLNEMHNNLTRIKDIDSNFGGGCARFVRLQLYALGLTNEQYGQGVNGYAYAEHIANGNIVNDGYKAIGYPTNTSNQIETFEKIISENGGSVSNLAISFTKGGSFNDVNGHAVLISKIEDGKVYFMDTFGCNGWGVNQNIKTTRLEPMVLTINEFEDTYLQQKNNANYMTYITKNDASVNDTIENIQEIDTPIQEIEQPQIEDTQEQIEIINIPQESTTSDETPVIPEENSSEIEEIQNNEPIEVQLDEVPVQEQEVDQPTPIENINTSVGNVSGLISPGTSETTFSAQPYNLSPEERRELIALVYSEATEYDGYIVADSMGVASTVLNRIEHGGFGEGLHDVISKGSTGPGTGQFHGYLGGKYNNAINSDLACVKPEMIAAVDRVLAGERNTNALYFSGVNDHSHSIFRK